MANKTKEIGRLMPPKQAPAPLTKEEKAAQIARFFTQKREQLFQGILFNAVHADPNVDLRVLVDRAIDTADYALEKLYPIPQEGDEK